MFMRDYWRSWMRAVCFVVLVAALGLLTPLVVGKTGVAGAQTSPACEYPFNNCPTTTTAPRTLRLFINLRIAIAGQPIHILACGVDNGTVVRFTFGGVLMATEVGRDTPPRSCSQSDVALGGGSAPSGGLFAAIVPTGLFGLSHTQAQAAQVPYVETTFNAPNLTPGTYPVCALAAGYDAACVDVRMVADTQVLGQSFSRSGGGTTAGGTSGSGTRVLGQSFARTGAELLLLVLVGLALVLVGRRLRRVA
jgi:hypothetical protein